MKAVQAGRKALHVVGDMARSSGLAQLLETDHAAGHRMIRGARRRRLAGLAIRAYRADGSEGVFTFPNEIEIEKKKEISSNSDRDNKEQ